MQEPADREMNPSDAPDVLRVTLKTPPRVPRFLYGVSILFAMTSVMMWGDAAIEVGGLPLLVALAAIGGLIPLLLVAGREPPVTPVVELGFDRLRLPHTAERAESMVLTYREIESLFMRPGRAGFIWVGTSAATFMYPLRSFRQPADAERLHDELRARIEARLPDGSERIAAFSRSASAALAAYRRPLFATACLVILIVAGTVATTIFRHQDIFNLVHLGALVPSLVVDQGQWWRVGTSVWLSLPPDGLVAATTVGVFGMMVERLFGSTHVLAVAAGAIGLGSVMTLLSSASISFGATPVAVGLFAGLAFIAQARPALLPVGFRPPGTWWVVTGLLLGSLIFMLSNQDSSMLFGGAVAGVLITALRLREDTKLPLEGPAPNGLKLIAVGALLMSLGCWGLAIQNVQSPRALEKRTLLTLAQNEGWGSHPIWNEMAWRVAVSPSPDEDSLEMSANLAERAVSQTDQFEGDLRKLFRSTYVDTLATVRFRQARFDEAISLERALVTGPEDLVYVTQLARFLERRAMTGSSTVTDGLPKIELGRDASDGFGVRVDGPIAEPITVWGVINNADGLQGLCRISLGPDTPIGELLMFKTRGTQPAWPADVRMLIADVQPGRFEWRTWGIRPDIADLP